MKFKEVEFKYNADNIGLSQFTQFCLERKPLRFFQVSGYDHFYAHKKREGSFCRHRIGPDQNQLTFKRKTEDANNYIRTEHNISLTKEVSIDQIQALCSEFDYEYNTSIFKSCFIYSYDWYTLVYYICYDKDMKELGKFFEIEMKEDHPWENEQDAWGSLVTMERFCKPLGVTAQGRIKRSLFELFKK